MRLVACGQFRSQGLQLLMRLRLRSVERRRLNVPLAPCGLNDQFLLRRAAGGQFRSQLLVVMQPSVSGLGSVLQTSVRQPLACCL